MKKIKNAKSRITLDNKQSNVKTKEYQANFKPPSIAVPHRPASPALCPCGHAASFRGRASSFVRGAWSSAALRLAAVL